MPLRIKITIALVWDPVGREPPSRTAPMCTVSGAEKPPNLISTNLWVSFSALVVRLLAPPSFGVFDGVDGEGFELGGQLAEAAGVVEPVPVTVELLRG